MDANNAQPAQNQAQPQTQGKVKMFDPSKVASGYTNAEWQIKEDWYSTQLGEIVIPPQPSIAEFQNLISALDRVSTTARLDYANVERNYNNYELLRKIEEREEYIAVQNAQNLTVGNKNKLTIDDINSLVTMNINHKKWNGGQYSLYELVSMASKRMSFMKGVIESIKDKSGSLILVSASLKMETNINSMTPSVPQYTN